MNSIVSGILVSALLLGLESLKSLQDKTQSQLHEAIRNLVPGEFADEVVVHIVEETFELFIEETRQAVSVKGLTPETLSVLIAGIVERLPALLSSVVDKLKNPSV